NPYVEEARNQVAVERGPIVYCLESVDLPKDVRVMDVSVPRDLHLSPQRTEHGVVALRGEALATPVGDWSQRLYREVTQSEPRRIELTLVPYYAWDNRGESEMNVFLPLVR